MRAALFEGSGSFVLADLAQAHPGDGEITVAVDACGICGSDLHVVAGHVKIDLPRVLGHEFSGRVAESARKNLLPGDRVVVLPLLPCGVCSQCRAGRPNLCRSRIDVGLTVDGAFAEEVLIPRAQRDVTVFPLPDTVSDAAGAVVEPLAVALRAVSQAGIRPGSAVLVSGAGMIGQGVVAFLSLSGVGPIVVVDPSPFRRAQAIRRGADEAFTPEELEEDGRKSRRRFDAAIEGSGHHEAPAAVARHLRPGATLVAAAVYGSQVALPLDRVVGLELVVRGTFAYTDEFSRVIRLIAAGTIDAESFITTTFPLSQIDEAFALQRDAEKSIKVLVTPEHEVAAGLPA